MKRNRKSRRKVRLVYFKFIFIVILLIIIISMTMGILARYRTTAHSNAEVDLAYYLIKSDRISQDLKIDSILPRDDPYIYSFSIANNNGTDRTQTAIEYVVEIKTTTNLPLNYKVHKNGETENLIQTQSNITDDDGTYYNYMTLKKQELGFRQNEETVYKLEIEFPKQYNSSKYEGTIEYIQMTVTSKQKIN